MWLQRDHTFVSNYVGFLALLEPSITEWGQLIKCHQPDFWQVWKFLKITFLPSNPSWFSFQSHLRKRKKKTFSLEKKITYFTATRWTSGSKVTLKCHPFKGRANTWLFHEEFVSLAGVGSQAFCLGRLVFFFFLTKVQGCLDFTCIFSVIPGQQCYINKKSRVNEHKLMHQVNNALKLYFGLPC